MEQKTLRHSTILRMATGLVLVVCLYLTSPLPAAAQGVGEYFQFNYDPVIFSKSEIAGDEQFFLIVLGQATSTKDLPVAVSEAIITSRVIAKHVVNDSKVTLNPSYNVTVKPFPSKVGESSKINQVVPLQFPAQAEAGDYNVIGEIIKAEVKFASLWIEVTKYLPQSRAMGTLRYTIAEETSPEPTTPEPTTPEQTATESTPPSAETSAPAATIITEYIIPWWVWLIVTIAVASTIANILFTLLNRP